MNIQQLEKLRQINYYVSEIDGLYHQAAVKLGLSDSALRILYELYVSGGKCPQSNIYKNFGLSKQTVHSALKKLEAEGVVALEKGSGKAKMVYLTAEGEKKSEATVARLVAAEMAALADWTEKEMNTHISLTAKSLAGLRAQIETL